MIEYGYNLCALTSIILFSKHRVDSNRMITNELDTLRTKNPSLSKACDKLLELISEAKLRSKLSSLSTRSLPNNPENSSKFIEH